MRVAFCGLLALLPACHDALRPENLGQATDAAADASMPQWTSDSSTDTTSVEGAAAMGADAFSLPADLHDGGPPAASATSAPSFLINTAHTNAVVGSSLQPPLTRTWTANLPGAASYPLIAEGHVYAVAAATDATGTAGATATATVLAFDATTGAKVWSASLPNATSAGLAYDNGRVFTEDSAGLVSAFDAATGVVQWTQSMAGPYTWVFSKVPTAYRGILYTSAGGDGGTLFAFDEATGALIFQNLDMSGGDDSPPAVQDDGLIVAYPCTQTYKRDRFTGALLWHYATECSGGGADTPVVKGSRVYITESMRNVAIDNSTGTSVGTFSASVPPAFDDAFGLFVSGTQLTAIDSKSGLTAWTFAGDNGVSFRLPPLLAAGYVYTIDSNSKLTAFSESTGKAVWSDAVTVAGGEPIEPMAASGALLVVPEGMQLVAYMSAGDGGTGPGGTAGGDGGCAFNMADIQEPAAGSGPAAVAIADLNGDGKADIAVADENMYGPGTVSVLLGIGDGTFHAPVAYAVGQNSNAVAIADLNGDHWPDLAVLNSGTQIPASSGASTVSVLLGNGDGTFQAQRIYATYEGSGLAIADFNGDGKLDFAVGGVSVLLGNGDGTFQSSITTQQSVGSIVAGDLNGDGKPDLAGADGNYDVDVLINNGNGTFQAPVPYPAYKDPCCVTETGSVAMGDVNKDGKLDVAVAGYGTSSVSVFLGNGDGTLQTQVRYTTNSLPQTVKLGDVNGDGALDLVVAYAMTPDLSVLLGNGDGTFQPQLFFAVKGTNTGSMAVSDVNGDGKDDIVATSSPSSVGVLLSTCGH